MKPTHDAVAGRRDCKKANLVLVILCKAIWSIPYGITFPKIPVESATKISRGYSNAFPMDAKAVGEIIKPPISIPTPNPSK